VKQHFSEADLLETYYTQPGQSMPVMMHLADCDACAANYERLEAKMRGLRSCPHAEKPETFWARQRISIMRRIDARRERRISIARVTRIAAAAMLVLVLGGLITWDRLDQPLTEPVVETVATAAATTVQDGNSSPIEESPWQSEELDDYSSIVAWESWVEDGDQSS
jgi:anti-sigma factor RsiW